MKLRAFREQLQKDPRYAENPGTDSLQKFLEQNGIEKGTFFQEVEMSYEYVEAQYDVGINQETMSLHSHPFYEMIFVKQGKIQYLMGTERHRIQPGDILIIPPGSSHRPLMLSAEEEAYERYVIWMSRRFISEMLERVPEMSVFSSQCSFIRPERKDKERLETLFARIIEECERQNTGWQIAMCAGTSQLLIYLLRHKGMSTVKQPPAEDPELLDEILLYIEENLSSRITLEETARHFLVSTSRVKQTFSTQLGTSFYRSVIARRLIEAKKQINAGVNLEEVAENVGFGDYTAFYRAFKKEFGIAPSKYREITSGTS